MEKPPPTPSSSSATVDRSTAKHSSKRPRSAAVKNNNPPRANNSENSDNDNVKEPNVVLTPHTLRLLKLVQEGSIDHARLAATHLEELTRPHHIENDGDNDDNDDDDPSSQQSSPLVLWELLGRLQGYLGATDWSTRANAGLAMEGVARNLPLGDQTAFLRENLATSTQSSSWLQLQDVQDNLTTILEHGRWLVASAESKYQVEREEQVLERLSTTTAADTGSAESKQEGLRDFCARRLELQRQILARRLGLSDVMTRYTTNVGEQFQHDLVEEGLEAVEETTTTNSKEDHRPSKKRTKRKGKQSSPPSSEAPNSIRSLLVMEIRQQQQQQDSSSQTISHRNPQNLLAGELVYRMFDPSWHVRHGSLMGILALIRAWKVHQKTAASTNNSSSMLFGTWPHDILARTLCVLALDRFGDFSGTSTEAFSGSMVAPVRELAAQVFSVVFFMAPVELQRQGVALLSNMLQSDEWEVRQGVMLAIKYYMALSDSTMDSEWKDSFVSISINMAISGLEDTSDDVQGVAAQTLRHYFDAGISEDYSDYSDFRTRTIRSVWKSLANIRLFSSSLENLVTLFCRIVKEQPDMSLTIVSAEGSTTDGIVKIFQRFCALLGSEFLSVKASIVHVIRSLAEQLPDILAEQKEQAGNDQTNELKRCFCDLVKSIYNLQMEYSILNYDESDTSGVQLLLEECSLTWSVLSTIQDTVVGTSAPMRQELEKCLLSQFFLLHDVSGSNARHLTRASSGGKLSVIFDMATFLARFWTLGRCDTNDHSGSYDLLLYTFLAGLESPLVFHCEASCCLLRAMFHANQEAQPDVNAVTSEMLRPCIIRLLETLQKGPTCLALNLELPKLDQKTTELLLNSFRSGFDVVAKQDCSKPGEQAAAAVVELWQKLIPSETRSLTATKSVDSMRLSSQLAGSLLSGGLKALPEKLTPIVRPLMTSVQNERDEQCQIANCDFLYRFLALLQETAPTEREGGFKKTFSKVMSSLCKFVASGNEPSCAAASRVIGSLVMHLPLGHSLRTIAPISENLLPLYESWNDSSTDSKQGALQTLKAACHSLRHGNAASEAIIREFLPILARIGCEDEDHALRDLSLDIIRRLCSVDDSLVLEQVAPVLIGFLKDEINDAKRSRACSQLGEIFEVIKNPATITPFVRKLLPVVMSLMTDSIRACAEVAAGVFSRLVQLAPLVKHREESRLDEKQSNDAVLVIDHLIHGKKLPPCDIPKVITRSLSDNGIFLRNYQIEGISWLRFLQSVKLNGALCDSMGLGKTLQALVAVALSHLDNNNSDSKKKRISLVVCPSSVVGHWVNEIERFFPDKALFRSVALMGSTTKRREILAEKLGGCNIVVTSYAVMRSEIDKLSKVDWTYAILDEGHLLKNPKTATARASRRLRARHKLIMTGTPVQNRVGEVWATFDFLMPNFLGSSDHFSKEFAKPISKGQKLDATAVDVAAGMEQLKILHQQVLPFILRREKGQVLKELPPKIVTRIPCAMSSLQEELYRHFCSGSRGNQSLLALHKLSTANGASDDNSAAPLSSNVLKSLLYLRLLCTHPWLVRSKSGHGDESSMKKYFTIETSGKLLALLEILRETGIKTQDHTAADNDSSLLYCDDEEDVLGADEYLCAMGTGSASLDDDFVNDNRVGSDKGGSRCLIFAQFMDSLDIVEELVLKRYMPSARYLRLDGRVPATKRSTIVDAFNQDESIKVLLLTTKIGGLGLNLTGADTVIFLEHDWNPHMDLQAMDRAHRLGQKKTVHVYKLITQNSIEETTMAIHERKLTMSSAIVNTENSSLYSMGTDRLLDIFSTAASSSGVSDGFEDNLDALVERYQDEYQSLSMEGFVKSFQRGDEEAKEQSS